MSPGRRSRRRRFIPWGLGSCLLAACVHDPRPTDDLFAGFTVQGHRGAAGLAPENTLAAFDSAAQLGVGFELDTQLSADGVLVVFHDDQLDRLTPASGPVHQRDADALTRLDAGSHFEATFAEQRIPTLAQVLDRYAERVVINIEIKAGKDADVERLAAAVVELLTARGLTRRVLVTSFSPFVLEAVRELDPEIRRGQIYSDFRGAKGLSPLERVMLRNLAFNRRARPDVLSVNHRMVDAPYLRRMHRRGYRVFAWTVNDPEDMKRLMALGVDGIITDRPDLLLDIVDDRERSPGET